jgi:tetratricopeptide (TPR) repeat protein/4-amino-4-deoxy-L-arabinose transferase-like glycosyltransferase
MKKVSVRAGRRNPTVSSGSGGLRLGIVVFLLAAMVRGIYLYDGRDNPTFSVPVVDSLTCDLVARELAQGWGMSREFFWQQFFYPLFLSVVYFFSDCSILAAKIVQIVLGSVTCVLIYTVGMRIFGRAAGLAAGLLAAFYGPLFFFDLELLSAGWACFWAAALILLLLETAEKKSAGLCFGTGLCAGLSVLTRPNFVPFLLAAGVWLAIVWIRGQAGRKKVATALVVAAGGFLLVTLPVAAKNWQVTGRFSFLPRTGGLNLYIGNNPDFEAVALRPGTEWSEVVALPLKQGLRTPEERQRFYYAKTFEYVRGQPMSFLRGLVCKTAQVTSSREMPGHIDVYMFRRWSRVLGWLMWRVDGFGFPFGILLPLSLLGMLFFLRKLPVPLVLFLVFYPASIILTHVEARYRMPVIVPMCVLAGAGLVKIAGLVGRKRWGSVVTVAVFSVAVGFVCSIAGPFYGEKHINYDAELHYVLAGSLKERGRIAEAVASYRTAIKVKPEYWDAYQNLGLVLVEQGRPKEAAELYEKAIGVFGEEAGLREGLGLALFEQGRVEDAIEQYKRALQIDPQRASVHDNLGRALFQLNRLSEAQTHFSRAVELNPNDAMSHNNIGSFLAIQGRLQEAIEHFEMSLSIRPRDAQTLTNLASALAAAGKWAEAEKKFRQALRVAPNDAEIYFNMGLCLHQQGRFFEAMNAYKKTLAMDPGHKRARQALKEMLKSKP